MSGDKLNKFLGLFILGAGLTFLAVTFTAVVNETFPPQVFQVPQQHEQQQQQQTSDVAELKSFGKLQDIDTNTKAKSLLSVFCTEDK